MNRTVYFDIPPQPLSTALLEFSRQTDLQVISADVNLHGLDADTVRGNLTIARALTRLLRHSGLSYKPVGMNTFVIGPFGDKHERPSGVSSTKQEKSLLEVVVTARYMKENALKVPQSITVFDADTIDALNIESFSGYATKVPNLSFAYNTGTLGYGDSRTIAVRGISGLGTTAVYIDGTPIPEGIDPPIIDIQRIEVLKGPQGTLFGEGSLGGNVRLIRNQPSLSGDTFDLKSELGATRGGGSVDYGASSVGNFVLVDDQIALRFVGFENHDAGFIARTAPAPGALVMRDSIGNQGAIRNYGGSLSILFQVSDSLRATAGVMAQHTFDDGLPVAYAPLPRFIPNSYTMHREANIQEFVDDNWVLPSLEIVYDVPGLVSLTSSSSFFRRHEDEIEDGTEGTTTILSYYGVPTSLNTHGYAWPVYTREKEFNQEVRTAFQGNRWIHGVVGAFLSRRWNEFGYPPFMVPGLAATGLWPTDLAWSSDYPALRWDKAVYGEAYLSHASFELTLGVRKYWVHETSTWVQNGLLNGGLSESINLRSGDAGINPKVAISYELGAAALVYASVSKGFRAGFPNPVLPKVCDPGLTELGVTRQSLADVYPDTVWNYEIGAKREVDGLVLMGALYQMSWQNIQQRVTIPICNNNIMANAGAARNRGAEFELTGAVSTAMQLRLAAGFDDAVITHPGLSGQPVGSPVYNAPRITFSAAAAYRWHVSARLEGFIEADDSYVSNSLSGTTLSGTAALTRAGYDLLNARAGLRWGSNELALYGRNLTDRRANLGDINPISYVQRDANGEPLPRVAVMAPLQLGIQMRHGF